MHPLFAAALAVAAGCAVPRQDARSGLAPAPRPVEETRTERMVGYFPDVVLTGHDGREVRFYEDLVEGRMVLIHFMYTTCDGI